MSKNGASANDIKGQQDLITKAQANLNFQTVMTTKDANGQDYVVKAIAVDTASADLAAAKSVVAGLTKAYGSNRPSDPTQLATINTAMVVQALAQDKADQSAAAAAAVRLTASGASKSDIQTQTDLVATKQNDMANILKANPKVAAMAGVAANANSKTVQAAINGLISNAASVSGAAVNLTAAQAAAALQALQQLQAGAGKTTARPPLQAAPMSPRCSRPSPKPHRLIRSSRCRASRQQVRRRRSRARRPRDPWGRPPRRSPIRRRPDLRPTWRRLQPHP